MEKITLQHPNSQSADLIKENIEQLKQLFPEVIKEGKVDFEALNDLLGNYADTAEERFSLNWAGKTNARREAQKRSTGTLRPCPEDSVDWNTTQNLYIEGDNLEVLKLLQKSYHSQVKMIYIDPPYNTGKDFVYKDNYTDNMANYLALTGQDKKMSTNTESDGRYHSNWLNMMYPRLKLVRNLLTDNGVIFISIDDNEVDNLRKVCDEIFGEENFVSQIIVQTNPRGRTFDRFIAKTHEYILVYSKYIDIEGLHNIPKVEKAIAEYSKEDEYGKFRLLELRNRNPVFNRSNRPLMFYPIYADPNNLDVSLTSTERHTIEIYPRNSQGEDGCWTWGLPKAKNEVGLLVANLANTGKWSVFRKDYLEGTSLYTKSKALWLDKEMNHENGKEMIGQLFGKTPFDFPKSVDYIKKCLQIGTYNRNGDLILDFFSGSATTAHAVMQLNAEDDGNRKYICVQLPEQTPEDSVARNAGYQTIPEIAKKRIRLAGKKILEEQKVKSKSDGLFTEEAKKLDVGFKVFKLDSSNINAWDNSPKNLENALHNSLFNIKEDRSEDDLLYEILIKYGIELTENINRREIAGKTIFEIGAGSLIVCLGDNLTTDVAEGIGKLWNEVRPDGEDVKCRVVFKDSGFNGLDEIKTNTMLILKQHGITSVTSV